MTENSTTAPNVFMQLPIDLRVGSRIQFAEERQMYTVRARGGRYAVCTKPFNARKTVLYTIIDSVEQVRGTENLVFGMGAETDEECWEMLKRLEMPDKMKREATEVSHRNRIPLRITKLFR